MANEIAMCLDTHQCRSRTMAMFSLVVQIVMIILFAALLLFVIIQLILIRAKGTTFVTRTIFFVLILCFSLGRVVFFSLTLLTPEAVMPPNPYEITQIITEFCYHWSSAFFYSAFAVLTIHFGENLFFASGFSVTTAAKRTRQIKMTTLLFLIYVHICQIAIFIVMSIFMHFDQRMVHMKALNKTGTNISYVVQYSFDGVVSWVIVIFFALWIYWCTKSLWKDVLAQNVERMRTVSKMRISAVVFCILLILKGAANFFFALYQADCAWMCPTIQIIVNGFCAIALDFLPVFIVVLVFAIPIDHIRDSGDITDRNLLIPSPLLRRTSSTLSDMTRSSSLTATPVDYLDEYQEEESNLLPPSSSSKHHNF